QRGAPAKGRTRPYVRDARSVLKAPPRSEVAPERRAEGPGVKLPAARVLEVPEGRGAKRPRPVAQADSSLRLTINLSAAGALRIVGAARVAGARGVTDVVRGTLLYVLRDNTGNVLHFGTMADPLEQHSYLPGDVRHDQARAAEATFNVPVPAQFSDRAQLANATLELYDARAASLPARLDNETLTRVIRAARPYGRVALEQALQYLNR
ncbi:MAG: hypothetical protein ACT4R6_03245, partial [Gemmatimonadaceae bacterium]